LRPIIVTDAKASSLLTQDRYDGIRNLQENTQPTSNWILPNTGAPLLPAFESVGSSLKPTLMLGTPALPK
jgi:general secretion pathway protein D